MSRKRKRHAAVSDARRRPAVTRDEALQLLVEEQDAHDLAMRRLVELAAAVGATGEAIASTLGVSRPTLYRRFSSAMRAGRLR